MDQETSQPSFEPIERKKHSPFYRFVAALTALGLFLLSVEGYRYLIHPEPKMNLALADVQSFLSVNPAESFSSHRPEEIKSVLDKANDILKQVANKIAADSCRSGDRVCQSKALFYFVRDQIIYVPDPRFHDALANPLVTLKTGGADCEDMAVLLAGLQKAIGNQARLVFISGHVYAQVKIPDYKDQWLNMEATCKTCGFNEIPTDTLLNEKEYEEL